MALEKYNYEDSLDTKQNNEIAELRINDIFKDKIDINFLGKLRKIFDDNNLDKSEISPLFSMNGKERIDKLEEILNKNDINSNFLKKIPEKTNDEIKNIKSKKINFDLLSSLKSILENNGYSTSEMTSLFSKLDRKGIENKKEIRENLKKILEKQGLDPKLLNIKTKEKNTKKKQLNKKLEELFNKAGLDYSRYKILNKQKNSEKEKVITNIKNCQEILEKGKNIGFYNDKTIQSFTKQLIEQPSIKKQEIFIEKLKNLAKSESKGFIALKDTTTIAGVNVKKFSKESYKQTIDYYYQSVDKIEERQQTDIVKMVENEAKLLKNLEQAYGEKRGLLRLAIHSFSELDYMSKEKKILEYKKIAQNEDAEQVLLDKAINTKINIALTQEIISKEDVTIMQKFFKTGENFTNKLGDKNDINLKKEAFEILIGKKEHKTIPTLQRYKKQNELFNLIVNEFLDIKLNKKEEKSLENKKTKEEIEKLKNKFKSLKYKEKEKEILKLRKKIIKTIKENNKKEDKEINKKNTTSNKETTKKTQEEIEKLKQQTIQESLKLIGSGKPQEALDLLSDFNRSNPGNRKIIFFMNQAVQYMMQFQIKESIKQEEKNEEEILQKIEIEFDKESIKDEMKRIKALQINADIIKKNEEKFKSVNATNRSKNEVIQNTNNRDQNEATRDFFDINEKEFENNEITKINLNSKDKLNLSFLKRTQNYTKDSITENQNIQFIDSSGNISAKRAENILNNDEEKLTEKILKFTQAEKYKIKQTKKINSLSNIQGIKNLNSQQSSERLKNKATKKQKERENLVKSQLKNIKLAA